LQRDRDRTASRGEADLEREDIHLAREGPFRLGALTIEPSRRRVVHNDGREEILEPRVMQVLVALAKADGQILSRDELIASCWAGMVVSEDALHRVVNRLRRLAETFAEFRIETIKKVGYRLVENGAGSADGDAKSPSPREPSICVLPFANISDDPQQEYFSDSISEDIIIDLSKISALNVIARNTSFQFKGKNVDVTQVARQLKASHILEGGVRKAGGRVRITAQLIDSGSGNHIWAELYDRDLNDIFALQDEISQAIVKALKLKLLPEERKAIEQRGTTSAEAYRFYLLARQFWLRQGFGLARRGEAVIRLTTRATQIDPNYAQAWVLMSLAQSRLVFYQLSEGHDALAAAQRALLLDDGLADAHAAMAHALLQKFRVEEAGREIAKALALDPESHDVLHTAAHYSVMTKKFTDAIRYYEKAATVVEHDFSALAVAMSRYHAIGDTAGARDAAKRCLARIEPVIAVEPDNGMAMSYQLDALAVLGEAERAKDVLEVALVLDPDNWNMRYNFACAFIKQLGDLETGLDLLEQSIARMSRYTLQWVKNDFYFHPVRDHPRFKAMLKRAEGQLATRELSPRGALDHQ
jgi:adenylate cyclase